MSVEEGIVLWGAYSMSVEEGIVLWGAYSMSVEEGIVLWGAYSMSVEEGIVLWGNLLSEWDIVGRILDSIVYWRSKQFLGRFWQFDGGAVSPNLPVLAAKTQQHLANTINKTLLASPCHPLLSGKHERVWLSQVLGGLQLS